MRMNLNKKRGDGTMSLSDVPVGFEAKIISVPDDDVGSRLLSIGFVPGNSVKVISCAPLGDPRVYMVMGKMVTLRNDEAKRIQVSMEDEIEQLSNVTEGSWRVIHLVGGRNFRDKLRSMGIDIGSTVKVISKGVVETNRGVFRIGLGMARRIYLRRDDV
ncbi:iron transporter FeoA [Pseudothermotoga hypogea DSM 11164 = NBRC 106472]|uniref:Iron transporter FeoA n=1 Tax=Pseudothermotoga hypogea DSM 11164 = NBRC 106472 TaxID=1123384 RepID=A0A0X1KP05_9THEM|nr:iron transporter FeoA [Pseudothermotoga hypogea DSM 11164 = NBRC 106472]